MEHIEKSSELRQQIHVSVWLLRLLYGKNPQEYLCGKHATCGQAIITVPFITSVFPACQQQSQNREQNQERAILHSDLLIELTARTTKCISTHTLLRSSPGLDFVNIKLHRIQALTRFIGRDVDDRVTCNC